MKIDWKKLMSLPKYQRDIEIKQILKKQKEENNSYFNETINVKGVYNRLVTFDGNSFHAAHVSLDKERLILILFFNQFLFKKTGINYPLEGKDKI